MGETVELNQWFQDADAVACVLPAERYFGMMRRTLELPGAFAALTRAEDGSARVWPAGARVPGDGVAEMLLVRALPFELILDFPQLPAADQYLCDARVTVQVQVLTERTELEALAGQVLGSRTHADSAAVVRYLAPHLERALRAFVAEHQAGALVEARVADQAGQVAHQALAGPCFSGGLAVRGTPVVTVTSAAWGRTREAAERAARALDEHAAQSELRSALADAQRTRLSHLESMLERLNTLAERSPGVELSELMRAFEHAQRGELYQALFAARARQRTTASIAVITGDSLLFYDARDPSRVVRRVELQGACGAPRSLQHDPAGGRLLVGAARGVYVLDEAGDGSVAELPAASDAPVRGGFNEVAARGDVIVATHSELGVWRWSMGKPQSAAPLLADLTDGARTVRAAQFAAGRLWFALDERVICVDVDDLSANPRIAGGGAGTISALCACGEGIYAGTSDGDVLHWPDAARLENPKRIHGGSNRPVESIVMVTSGGIARLFFTDTSLAVHCRVPGDSFVCRFEAGGQTVRRAACAADVVAATTDARDRVLVWTTEQPARPVSTINIYRETGRSVQDVCLIPLAHTA
jgi:hypothetical protein